MSRILVTVGTDHHPFQRLVDWADSFAERHPEHEVFVQYGSARPPRSAEQSRLLDHAQLLTEIARADVVVCHGGPATITDVRRSGLQPVCVPRDPRFGEHVDEHQLLFADRLGKAGLIDTRTGITKLDDAVHQALDRPRSDPTSVTDIPEGVRRVGQLVGEVLNQRNGSMASQGDDPIRVVFIGGQGRSGSTLIERALGELPGVASIGETVHLWDRGLRDDELCGCGQPFSRCSFWSQVGEVAFGGWDQLDADDAVDLRFSVDRNRYLPLLMRPHLSGRYERRHEQYAERLTRLYRAIAQVSGAHTIIDSSKHASYALLLSRMPALDLRLLHVVRDSRAVAHAWTKTVARPEAGGLPMPVYGPAKAAVLWDVQNAVIERLGASHPYLRIRYEDFVQTPKDVLVEASRLAGVDDDSAVLSILDGDTLTLGPSHTVAGNPMRFVSGNVTIRSDETWRREMPTTRRRFVAALTLPLQHHYGYGSRVR
ncbi:MAG TPA: glycosyltransferase [Actinomycetes bacterium]|nr:glycosyltransferase [Actinomycetes bacterium]